MAEDSENDARDEELASLYAIFPELRLDPNASHSASLNIPIEPRIPLAIAFEPMVLLNSTIDLSTGSPTLQEPGSRKVEESEQLELDLHEFSHLPALSLKIDLPDGYPDNFPPQVTLSAGIPWLPNDIMKRLSTESEKLWHVYGHSQVIFAYIDYLQQEVEDGFNLEKAMLPLRLPQGFKSPLLNYERQRRQDIFNSSTFDCGVCLEPKKGVVCHKLPQCGHIFCVQCLQDFYAAAITEGDISTVRCLEPDCGTENMTIEQRRGAKKSALHPRELLAIPLDHALVKRYVDLKIKKKMEAKKNVVYCPRKWCAAPARTAEHRKYLAITDLADFPESEEEEIAEQSGAGDQLAVCSSCAFAFCRICEASWHGDFVSCRPKDDGAIPEEDKASYDYIRLNTSPCPTCDTPVQKTMGCNHMRCEVCNTHFCYLCSSWLDPKFPYGHFNTHGMPCFQRLWVLEEGDDGTGQQADAFRGARAAEMAAVQYE